MAGTRSPIDGTSRCAALVAPTIADSDGNAALPVVPEGVLVGRGKTSMRVSSGRASTAAESNIRQDIYDQIVYKRMHSRMHSHTHAHAPEQQQEIHLPHSSTAQLRGTSEQSETTAQRDVVSPVVGAFVPIGTHTEELRPWAMATHPASSAQSRSVRHLRRSTAKHPRR
jgi:hypothetical protein